ncbi:DgyrCDS3087 [Dimorphilus gyrociliatus]|uniref:DgyrCDS3087 n=1 Tax=Dimorphilus gyrociliatus TaxID=2664684 RepID=A0A7I8VDX0_9ANNE|nr:DgyrCDS3087 [Dimorphilus gyrociliatus]
MRQNMKKLLFNALIISVCLIPSSYAIAQGFKVECAHKPQKGICTEEIERFFYNVTSASCEKFLFGGCGDGANENNFVSLSECRQECLNMPPIETFDEKDCPIARCPSEMCKLGKRLDQYGCDTCECKLNICEDEICPTGRVCRSFTQPDKVYSICAEPDMPDACVQALDRGTGQQNKIMWHFFEGTRKCIPFKYGGEGGNENRYETMENCLQNCSNYLEPSYQICLQSKDEGEYCKPKFMDRTQKYYFNLENGQCEEMRYKGCRGNDNQFKSKEACEIECQGVFHKQCEYSQCNKQCDEYKIDKNGCKLCECVENEFKGCDDYKCPEGLLCQQFHVTYQSDPVPHCYDPKTSDICQRPVDRGNCRASISSFYYDSISKTCKTFTYGGCDGNSNRFLEEDLCEMHCTQRLPTIKPKPHCEEQECLHECPYGNLFTTDGCKTCQCLPPEHCDDLETRKCDYRSCPGGFKENLRGCPTCKCAEPGYSGQIFKRTCPKLKDPHCECEFGSEYIQGCSTCKCLPDPCHKKKCGKNEKCSPLESKSYAGQFIDSVCVPKFYSSRCTLPVLYGDGYAAIQRFAYDPIGNQCVEFTYSGLGGNSNNFNEKNDCEVVCGNRREKCKDVQCQIYCPYGRATNDFGCPICKCRHNPCNSHKCDLGFVCEAAMERYNRPFVVCVAEDNVHTIKLRINFYHDKIKDLKNMNIEHFKKAVTKKLKSLVESNFRVVDIIIMKPDSTYIQLDVDLAKLPSAAINLVQAVEEFRVM